MWKSKKKEKQCSNARNLRRKGSDRANGRKFLRRDTESKKQNELGAPNKSQNDDSRSEEKTKILRNKHKLKASNIFIDSDLTKKERTIQGIRKVENIEKGKRHEMRVLTRCEQTENG